MKVIRLPNRTERLPCLRTSTARSGICCSLSSRLLNDSCIARHGNSRMSSAKTVGILRLRCGLHFVNSATPLRTTGLDGEQKSVGERERFKLRANWLEAHS